MPNYGFIETPLDPNDWPFGSSGLGQEVIKPDGNWNEDLPMGEVQKRNDIDKMACVTYSALNCIETEFNYRLKANLISKDNLKWLMDKGYINNDKVNFSDRFIAKLSGTSQNGNSLKQVGDTIRKLGLIPESMLPYEKDMTWDEYYSGITNEMMKLGAEFLEHFKVNYEAVDVNQFNEALKYNPIQVAIHAYNGVRYENGQQVYLRTTAGLNHAVEKCKPAPKYDNIFDTYKVGDSFIKQMAPDFIYMSYGYRYIITEQKQELPTNDEPMPEYKTKTPRIGYLESDVEKILLPEGTELNSSDFFQWAPYFKKGELEKVIEAEIQKENSIGKLIKMIINKIINKN